jgi:hypothetical protein
MRWNMIAKWKIIVVFLKFKKHCKVQSNDDGATIMCMVDKYFMVFGSWLQQFF